jgi:hypothetical protein
MAENIGQWVPKLTEKECNEVVSAMNTFGPEKYRTNPLPYFAPHGLILLSRREVIGALRKVCTEWRKEASAARTALCKLEKLPPPPVRPFDKRIVAALAADSGTKS